MNVLREPLLLCLVGAAGLAACSDDASPVIDLDTRSADRSVSASAVAYRADGGAWKALAAHERGEYQIPADGGDLEVAIACVTADATAITYYLLGADDTRLLASPCQPAASPSGATTPVVLSPAGASVNIDHSGDLTGEAPVADVGVHDVLAYTATRGLILRQREIKAGQALELDVDAAGFAFEPHPVALAGDLAGDALSVSYRLTTAHGAWLWAAGDRGKLLIVPAAQRHADDTEAVVVSAVSAAGEQRTVVVDGLADAAKVTLPAPLGGGDLALKDGAYTAHWSGVPAGDSIQATLFWIDPAKAGQAVVTSNQTRVLVGSTWMAKHPTVGSYTVPVVTGAHGWSDAWNPPTTLTRRQPWSVMAFSDNEWFGTPTTIQATSARRGELK